MPASAADTRGVCCSSSPAQRASTTGNGASRSSPTIPSRSRTSSTRCASIRCQRSTRSSVRSSPACSASPTPCSRVWDSEAMTDHERLFVSFPEELVDRPMVYEIVKRFDVVPNIRRANVEAHSGWVILELQGSEERRAAAITYIEGVGGTGNHMEGDVLEG